jgi:hypothetical protein
MIDKEVQAKFDQIGDILASMKETITQQKEIIAQLVERDRLTDGIKMGGFAEMQEAAKKKFFGNNPIPNGL